MDPFTACENAYNNGYERGLKAAIKHGYWIEEFYVELDAEFTLYNKKCSECKKYAFLKTDFCPNCGAKMDAKK